MIPHIAKGRLKGLPEKRQRKICKCDVLCKEFYTFSLNDDFILCAKEAEQFALEIFEQLGTISKLAFPHSKFGWTTDQERFLKNYLADPTHYYNGKIKYGTYSMLGEMLGKTRFQVKEKIRNMKSEGKL